MRPVPAAVFDLPTVSAFRGSLPAPHLRPRISLARIPVLRPALRQDKGSGSGSLRLCRANGFLRRVQCPAWRWTSLEKVYVRRYGFPHAIAPENASQYPQLNIDGAIAHAVLLTAGLVGGEVFA